MHARREPHRSHSGLPAACALRVRNPGVHPRYTPLLPPPLRLPSTATCTFAWVRMRTLSISKVRNSYSHSQAAPLCPSPDTKDVHLPQLTPSGRKTMFPEAERVYMVQSVRFVKQAMLDEGLGMLAFEVGRTVYSTRTRTRMHSCRQHSHTHHRLPAHILEAEAGRVCGEPRRRLRGQATAVRARALPVSQPDNRHHQPQRQSHSSSHPTT